MRRALYAGLRQHAPDGVALAGSLPGLTISGAVRRADADETSPSVDSHPGSSTVFTVFGIRLRRGRLFTEQEVTADAPVAVLDERAAATLWPGEEAIGQLVRSNDGTVRTVVGVVGRIRERLVDDPPSTGTAFVPISADDRAVLVIRADSRGPSLAALETTVAALAPEVRLRVTAFRPFERTLGQPRFLAAVLAALGALTVTLTIVGIFGVVSHHVVRRRREIGIRAAFGANSVRLRAMVLRETATAAVAGIALGTGGALWWTSSLRALLYELEPTDPSTLLLCALFVLLLVVCAALPPAVRASGADPVEALRSE